jgi:hypothetical protein
MNTQTEMAEIATADESPSPHEAGQPPTTELEGAGDVGESHITVSWPYRWLRDWSRPAGYFVLSRFGVLFAALVSKWIFPRINIPSLLGDGWDGGWYVRIAQHGYPTHLFNESGGSRWAFFPAFPAAIRFVVTLTGLSYAHAAIVASTVFGLSSAIAVWLMATEVFGRSVADRAVLFYVFFPTAYVLSMAYAEGLFVTLSCLCLYALSRRRWIAAGILASFVSLTKEFGAVLVLCVFVATVQVILHNKERLRPIIGLLLAPVGIVFWLAYSWQRVGTPFAFVRAEKFWGQSHFVWFKTTFQSLGHLFSGPAAFRVAPDVLAAAGLVFMLTGIGLLLWAQVKGVPVPVFWWVFTVGAVLSAMSAYWPTGVLRYTLVLTPLMAAFAWKIRASWTGAVVGTLALSQGALAIIIFVAVAHPQATPLAP